MNREIIFLEHFINAVDFQEPVEMTMQTLLASLPEWDSLAALGVIVMCDMEYSKEVNGDDLSRCLTIDDIFKLLD